MKYNRKAFTLIELLVVITIIAMLSAILIPTLRKARAMAQFVVCRSNLRQMVVGLNSFTYDHRDKLLPYYLNSNLWLADLEPYIEGMRSVYLCPAGDKIMNLPPHVKPYWTNPPGTVSHVGTSTHAWRWQKSPDDVFYGSYLFNGYLYEFSGNPNDDYALSVPTNQGRYLFRRHSKIRQPSETPFMVDANWLDAWPQPTETIVSNLDLSLGAHAPGLNRLLLNRHSPYSGIAFMDGHVDKHKLEDLWLLKWHNWWRKPGETLLSQIRQQLPP